VEKETILIIIFQVENLYMYTNQIL